MIKYAKAWAYLLTKFVFFSLLILVKNNKLDQPQEQAQKCKMGSNSFLHKQFL
jgi:hypothetical protein